MDQSLLVRWVHPLRLCPWWLCAAYQVAALGVEAQFGPNESIAYVLQIDGTPDGYPADDVYLTVNGSQQWLAYVVDDAGQFVNYGRWELDTDLFRIYDTPCPCNAESVFINPNVIGVERVRSPRPRSDGSCEAIRNGFSQLYPVDNNFSVQTSSEFAPEDVDPSDLGPDFGSESDNTTRQSELHGLVEVDALFDEENEDHVDADEVPAIEFDFTPAMQLLNWFGPVSTMPAVVTVDTDNIFIVWMLPVIRAIEICFATLGAWKIVFDEFRRT